MVWYGTPYHTIPPRHGAALHPIFHTTTNRTPLQNTAFAITFNNMEWPFPYATILPSLQETNSEKAENIGALEAYAQMDQMFAMCVAIDPHFKRFLKALYFREEDTLKEVESNPFFHTCRMNVVRGLCVRSEFAVSLYVKFVRRLKEHTDDNETLRALLADEDTVFNEVDRTLGILRHFRDKFRPDLDGPIDELCKCMKWKERRDDIQAQLQLATTDGDDITATTAESTLLSLTSLHLD